MAYQHMDKSVGWEVNRTAAPDQVSTIRDPHGGANNPGTNSPQPSVIAPGMASESLLAQNLRASQADSEDVLSKVISGSLTGKRADSIPATSEEDWMERPVVGRAVELAHGMRDPNSSPVKIPGSEQYGNEQPVRKPD